MDDFQLGSYSLRENDDKEVCENELMQNYYYLHNIL